MSRFLLYCIIFLVYKEAPRHIEYREAPFCSLLKAASNLYGNNEQRWGGQLRKYVTLANTVCIYLSQLLRESASHYLSVQ